MRKLSLFLVMIVTVAVLSSGCSGIKDVFKGKDEDKSESTVAKGSDGSEISSQKLLKIYYFEDYTSLHSAVFTEFKKKHPDIALQPRVIKSDEYYNFYTTFESELSAGNSADIVSLPNYMLPDKLMKKGYFLDLNALVSGNKDFSIKDFNDKVIEVGVYNGKRFMIPIDYSFFYFFTYKSLLNGYNLDSKNWTWDDLLKIAKEYSNEKDKKCEYFLPANFSIWSLKYSNGKSFIDYDKNTTSFDSPEFIELLQTYKDLIPYICPLSNATNESDYDKILKMSLLQSDAISGIDDSIILSPKKKPFGEDPIAIPYPTFDGEKHTKAFPNNSVAITAECKNQKEAFDFIKIILSKEKQKDKTLALPINKLSLNEIFEKNKDLINTTKIGEIYQNIDGCNHQDGSIDEILENQMAAFINQGVSAEEIAKTIDKQAKELLNKLK